MMEKNKDFISEIPTYPSVSIEKLKSCLKDFQVSKQAGDSGSSLDEKKLNMGFLGRFFGTEKQAERSMVFILASAALLSALLLALFKYESSKEFSGLAGLLCGYFIGSSRSSSG